MRKLLFLAVAALLTVAIAVPVFAAETTMSGSYRVRGVSEWNWDKAPNGDDLYTGYFDQRFRLTITHKRSEFLKAVVSVDLVEDMWGQQRNFRMNNNDGSGTDGFINTAYIEAITKIGLFKVGVDNQGGRFGMGTWSDSGLNAGDKGNPGITWGIKINNFIATATYVKYVDLVAPVFANKAGLPSNYFRVWPGRAGLDNIGGDGSLYRNSDLNTYVFTAHYVTDAVKVGFLYQLIRDPNTTSAPFLVGGLADLGMFAGESAFVPAYLIRLPGPAFMPAWPNPANPAGLNYGWGRAGMYSDWLHIAAMYADLKFLDNKLELKAEYDRIWGRGDRNSRGDAYNNWLNGFVYNPALPAAGTTNLPPTYRLPSDIKIDGHTVYADLSYDFDVAKVGVAFLYGSGEKHWRAFTQHHYNFNTTGNDDFHWGNVIVPGNAALLGDEKAPLGLGNNPENITSVKLYWSVDPMEKLDIHGAFIWAKYTQPVGRYAGGVVTNPQPFYGFPINYALPATAAGYTPAHASDELGWEIDAGATYEIVEGLSLNSEFGVLFTGDAFDYVNASGTHEWGPIYRWVNTLTYSF